MEEKKQNCPHIKIEDATPTTNSSTEECSHSNPHYVYIVVNGNTIDSVHTRKKIAEDRRKYLIQQQVQQDETIETNMTKRVEVHKFQITHVGGRKTCRMCRG